MKIECVVGGGVKSEGKKDQVSCWTLQILRYQ